jgi:hypothetical protein
MIMKDIVLNRTAAHGRPHPYPSDDRARMEFSAIRVRGWIIIEH